MPVIVAFITTWVTRYLIFKVLKIVFTTFLGLVSYGFMQVLINKYINAALDELLNTDTVGLIMHLSRLDDAISIIIGAMTVCTAIKALGLKVTAAS